MQRFPYAFDGALSKAEQHFEYLGIVDKGEGGMLVKYSRSTTHLPRP
jgi:hypothetical protein